MTTSPELPVLALNDVYDGRVASNAITFMIN